MESGVKEFLEVSSIHGLLHISSNSRLARLFWILVVVTGFTWAIYMINGSLESWALSPISTTVEIKPIHDVKFPQVTVCPPEGTFTNLNYDYMMAANKTLDNATRENLIASAALRIQDQDFEKVLKEEESFFEENRYRNWYLGYTQPSLAKKSADTHYFNILTTATSGSISTPFFKEPYHPDKFQEILVYEYLIYHPPISNNVTFKLNIEALTKGKDKSDYVNIYPVILSRNDLLFKKPEGLPSGLVKKTFNYSVIQGENGFVRKHSKVRFTRYMDSLDNSVWRNSPITGMKLSWKYTDTAGDLVNIPPDTVNGIKYWKDSYKPTPNFIEDHRNKEFIRTANVFFEAINSSSITEAEVWQVVRNVHMEWLEEAKSSCENNMVESKTVSKKLNSLESRLGFEKNTTPKFKNFLSPFHLRAAGEIYIYLLFCPTSDGIAWIEFYKSLISRESSRTIMSTLLHIRAISTEIPQNNILEVSSNLLKSFEDETLSNLVSGELNSTNIPSESGEFT